MTKFIALVSGKGGVGKTTTTLNLGQALANLGKRVIILDANLMTPNIAINLGFINPEGTLNKFLRKEKSLKEITYLHESGLSIIPSSPSYSEFQKTNIQRLNRIFEHLQDAADFVLVDAPSGVGYELNQVLKHCDEALLVVNPTISSVMDAVKTIHVATSYKNIIPGVVLNMSHNGRHELSTEEIERTLGHPVLGNIRRHNKIRKALHKQMPLPHLYPRSRLAKEYTNIAEYLALQ